MFHGLTRQPRLALTKIVGLVVLAGCSAVVLHARVYEQFDRVRITVVRSERPSVDGSLVVQLPDVTRLAGMPTAVVLQLQNRSPETRTVGIAISGAELGRVVIRPGQTTRVDLSVAARPVLHSDDRVELIGNGDDWALQYLELANVHGFSSGLFSFVITPDDTTVSDHPSGIVAFFVFCVLLILSIPLFRLEVGGGVQFVFLMLGALVFGFLLVTLVLPAVSAYKLLLSTQAFSLCMATLYGLPILTWIARRAARPCATVFAIVARSLSSAYRGGTGLVLWPLSGIPYLAAHVRQRPMWAVGSIVASVLVVGVLVTTLRSTPQTYPVGDRALLATYTLHASHGSLSVGAYSKRRWNHPGPVYFYALAPLYVLTGGREFSLDWTALLINLVSAFALVTLTARYGGWSFGFGMIAALSIYFFRPGPGPYASFGNLLYSPWNAHVPMLPLALLLVLSAGLATGRVTVLPAVVLLGSFITQTHVGMVPCVVAVVGVAAAGAVTMHTRLVAEHVEAGSVPRGQPAEFWIFAAIWLVGLLWFLPLTEQLRSGSDGNVAAITRTFWSNSGEATPSLATAFSALSYAFSAAIWPHAPVARGGQMLSVTDFDPIAGIWVLLQLALLAAAGVWAVRTRRIFPAALCVICLVASGVAFWSITQVRGRLADYLAFWISIVSAVNLAAIIGVSLSWACDALRSRRARIPSIAGRVAVGGFCCLLVVLGVSKVQEDHHRTLEGEGRFEGQRESSRSLHVVLEDELRRHGHSRPLIRMKTTTWGTAAGVILQRYKAGAPVAVEDRRNFMFMDVFAATGEEDVEFLFTDAPLQDDVSDSSPYRLVAQQGATFLYTRSLESSSARGQDHGPPLRENSHQVRSAVSG